MKLNFLDISLHTDDIKCPGVCICKLRKKSAAATAGEHYIETVWGRGYVLRDPAKDKMSA